MDIGAYRDLHRHRRCQQFRQAYSGRLGFDTPDAGGAGRRRRRSYERAMEAALRHDAARCPRPARTTCCRSARARASCSRWISPKRSTSRSVRSGVKGHFSYRKIAWEMKQKMEELEPELGRLIEATPPWVEDPLKR